VAVVIYLAGLQAIPSELYEVASIDGATAWQRLRFVTIPLLAPSVTANTLLCIIGSLQSYQLIYVLTGPINPATQVLSLAIFTQGFGGPREGQSSPRGTPRRSRSSSSSSWRSSRWPLSPTSVAGRHRYDHPPVVAPAALQAAAVQHPETAHVGHRRNKPLAVVSYLLMLVVVVIYAYPLLFLINTALKSNNEFLVNPTGLVQSPQLANFASAWRQGNFGAYVLNSVLYTFVAAGLGTVMSLLVGFPVARGYVKHPRVWQGLFAAMLFLPNTLVTVFQLALRLGLYDTALGYILIMASASAWARCS